MIGKTALFSFLSLALLAGTARAADAYRRAAGGGGDNDPTATRANEQLQKLLGGGIR